MTFKNKQSGAVLATSLIILTILSLLTVSSSRTTILQERMTFGARDAHFALQSAELAISSAENYLDGENLNLDNFSEGGNGGLYTPDNAPSDLSAIATWADNKTAASGDTVNDDIEAGRYFIEYLGRLGDASVEDVTQICSNDCQNTVTTTANSFRIVARGKGLSENSQRIIISYYNDPI